MDIKLWIFATVYLTVKIEYVKKDVDSAFAVHDALFRVLQEYWSTNAYDRENQCYKILLERFHQAGQTFDKKNKQLKALRNAIEYYESHNIK